MRRTAGLLFTTACALLGALATSGAASAAVYDVPGSIAADCSVPVDSQLQAWLASVPDGSTARLGAGKCYGEDGTVTVADRVGLTIEGNGAELRALTPGGSHRANLELLRGSNLTVSNLTARGSNQGHSTAQWGVNEWQHGVSVEAVHGLLLDHVRVTEVWGDGIALFGASPLTGGPKGPSQDVTVRFASTSYTGRNGVSMSFVERAQLTDSTVGKNLGLAPLDIEPDDPSWYVRDVLVARNVFDTSRNRAIAFYGPGQTSNVTITSDNIFAKGRKW